MRVMTVADKTFSSTKFTNILLSIVSVFIWNFYSETNEKLDEVQKQGLINTILIQGYDAEQEKIESLIDVYHPRKTSNNNQKIKKATEVYFKKPETIKIEDT